MIVAIAIAFLLGLWLGAIGGYFARGLAKASSSH